jgi:hypothetical protein
MNPIHRNTGAGTLLSRGAPPVLALGVVAAVLLGMRPGTDFEVGAAAPGNPDLAVGAAAPSNPDLVFETPPLDLPAGADHHA